MFGSLLVQEHFTLDNAYAGRKYSLKLKARTWVVSCISTEHSYPETARIIRRPRHVIGFMGFVVDVTSNVTFGGSGQSSGQRSQLRWYSEPWFKNFQRRIRLTLARRLSAPPNVTFDVNVHHKPHKTDDMRGLRIIRAVSGYECSVDIQLTTMCAPSTSMNIFLPAYALSKVKCFLYQQAPPNIGPPPLSPFTKVSSSFGYTGTTHVFHVASPCCSALGINRV